MHTTRSDHPVFTRLTRQQLVVRRRHIGYQALILEPPTTSASPSSPRSKVRYCSYCHRSFTSIWKPYMCHVCGQWVCEPCSRVMERERVELVVRFIRCCESCLPLLNKWTPNIDELAAFTFSPWVVQSSVSPLGVNLAEMLRSRPERRQAALSLLRHLGKEVDTLAGVLLDDISETEWAATVSSSHVQHDSASDLRSSSQLIRGAQHFVQQCLDVRIPEVSLENCVLAEMDGRRSYPLTYPSATEVPLVPDHPMESSREEWIVRYNLDKEDVTVSEEVALICDLVAKEMESDIGVATVVMGERQWFIPAMRSEEGVLVNERKQSFSSHSLLTRNQPFVVRNAQLDVRFRSYNVVTAKSNSIQFFFGVPILAGDGVVVATLCALDTQPHKSLTTMQYSVMTALARVVAAVWREELVLKEGLLTKQVEDCADLAPTNQMLPRLVYCKQNEAAPTDRRTG